uniref:Uncharacterized protein n=1 Tax=Glossina austeni TaxID=7395 RepID=A0A1A9UU20_GLOAU
MIKRYEIKIYVEIETHSLAYKYKIYTTNQGCQLTKWGGGYSTWLTTMTLDSFGELKSSLSAINKLVKVVKCNLRALIKSIEWGLMEANVTSNKTLLTFGKACHPGSLCCGGNSFSPPIGEGFSAISSDLSESTGIKNPPSSSGVLHAVPEVGTVKVPYELHAARHCSPGAWTIRWLPVVGTIWSYAGAAVGAV